MHCTLHVYALLFVQPVCLVTRTWSRTWTGRRRLVMSSRCSSSSVCTPSWTGWPYTSNNRYTDDDESETSIFRDSGLFYYFFNYRYLTTQQTCPAVECRAPTGNHGWMNCSKYLAKRSRTAVRHNVRNQRLASMQWSLIFAAVELNISLARFRYCGCVKWKWRQTQSDSVLQIATEWECSRSLLLWILLINCGVMDWLIDYITEINEIEFSGFM